ncbi:Hypp426 [Branchiostoma lanceolatum]|uniref:Hypp426 protein n=1 Tax=Branchiostoma lanceolatum TaxID=7740 RepID=A0A8J9YNP0_BRALA|nr:Hypp426 [Branchiostoma lanceolatum]
MIKAPQNWTLVIEISPESKSHVGHHHDSTQTTPKEVAERYRKLQSQTNGHFETPPTEGKMVPAFSKKKLSF